MDRRPIKLTVAQFVLADLSGHQFNELLGYKSAAESLGLAPRILVPRTTPPRLAAPLASIAVLEPLADIDPMHPAYMAEQLEAFFDAGRTVDALWAAIESEGVAQTDLIVFPSANPILVLAVGRWLGRRPVNERPAIFFRFLGGEFLDRESGRFNARALLYRLASKDLGTWPGQERVFFLANSPALVRAITRMCGRRTFLMPMPKHLDLTAAVAHANPSSLPAIYIHLNKRSGRLIREVNDIVRRVRTVVPSARFLVKSGLSSAETGISVAPLDPDVAPTVEIIPAEQDQQDYLATLGQSTIILLAYQPHEGRDKTSGVFAEAASLGKIVVVPCGTWMAEQIAAGEAAGVTFDQPTPESIGDALARALHERTSLAAAARERSPAWRKENSCRRNIEIMAELARGVSDMQPRYHIGDAIDFSDHFDCRCFMGAGWGLIEPWGVWTTGRRAELMLRLEANVREPLLLRACVQPFLGKAERALVVRVSVDGEEAAVWAFHPDRPTENGPHWREAPVAAPGARDNPSEIRISFDIDAPMSPFALGLSQDRRMLGLGLRSLSFLPLS